MTNKVPNPHLRELTADNLARIGFTGDTCSLSPDGKVRVVFVQEGAVVEFLRDGKWVVLRHVDTTEQVIASCLAVTDASPYGLDGPWPGLSPARPWGLCHDHRIQRPNGVLATQDTLGDPTPIEFCLWLDWAAEQNDDLGRLKTYQFIIGPDDHPLMVMTFEHGLVVYNTPRERVLCRRWNDELTESADAFVSKLRSIEADEYDPSEDDD